jgi:hypothetical protein
MPDGVRIIYEVFMKDLVNIRIQPLTQRQISKLTLCNYGHDL